MMPRFTVVVPAYNVENEIERTIKSLTDCLTDEFELIVVNDESTDDTPARIDAALQAAKCPARRVDIAHAGVSVARNEGLRLAKGEYVAFVDADDIVTPDYASALLEFTSERKPDVVFFARVCDHKDYKAPDRTFIGISGENAIDICYRNNEFFLGHTASVYKRIFLEREQLLYTPGCRRSEDVEFVQKVLICAKNVDIYPQKLYIYLYREISATNTYRLYWFDSQDAMLRVVDFARENGVSARTIETFAMSTIYGFFTLRAEAMRLSRMSLRELNRELEKNYPGQTERYREFARKNFPLFNKNRLAMLAYSISPTATFALLRLIRPEFFRENRKQDKTD